MKDKIRWGILGCGNIAAKFASDLKLVDDAELVAFGSRDKDKARSFAERFSAAHVFDSYEALAQSDLVDAVYIATPHSCHYEHTMLCLENGKATLCEKAFAVNSRQAREMVRCAREKKLFLMEALWTKFLPQYQKLQEILQAGTLGDINAVLANFGFMPRIPTPARVFDPALAGGTLLDIGIYNVFMAMSVLGRPQSIDACMKPAYSGVDEQCSVLFRYDNGAMAQLFSSFMSRLPIEADICGTKGRIRFTHRFYSLDAMIEYYPDGPESRQLIDIAKDAEGHGYQYEARHVCDCLRKGLAESPVMTHADTLLLMEVLDEIRRKSGIRYDEDYD